MSTRCQLRFTDPKSDCVAQVYRHSDGYPESVLSNLQHLRELLHHSGALRDATYAAAQFLFVDKLWSLERTFRCQDGIYSELPETVVGVLEADDWQQRATTPPYLLGHGVEDPSCGIHGDEEFLYVVELPAERHGDWQVKLAGREHFPRWDDEKTDEAFEVAEWQFDGPLEEGIAKLGPAHD